MPCLSVGEGSQTFTCRGHVESVAMAFSGENVELLAAQCARDRRQYNSRMKDTAVHMVSFSVGLIGTLPCDEKRSRISVQTHNRHFMLSPIVRDQIRQTFARFV
jgi:hypothetical protein